MNGTSIMSNSVDSMLGDLSNAPIKAESQVHQEPSQREKTEFFAFLDMFQGLTKDIRGLQAKVRELSPKNEKLLTENYDLKLENIRLQLNWRYKSFG